MFALKSHGLRFLALVFRMSAREKKKEKKKNEESWKKKRLSRGAQEENEGKI